MKQMPEKKLLGDILEANIWFSSKITNRVEKKFK
jgi:hypothetical protein